MCEQSLWIHPSSTLDSQIRPACFILTRRHSSRIHTCCIPSSAFLSAQINRATSPFTKRGISCAMTSDTSWSTEDRVNDTSAKESSLISKGGSAEAEGLCDAIETMEKFHAIRAALVDAEEKLCAVEEELFGELPISPGTGSPFIEKSFGSEFAPRQKRYLTGAKVPRDLSSIVVSIALFDGDKMLFACSGIPLPYGRTALRLTRFVTSARLATAYTANRNRDDNLRVEVRLPDNSTTGGLLGLYD
ncbi:hypothetical protein ACQJBY_054749 [Aegilops geniculata]